MMEIKDEHWIILKRARRLGAFTGDSIFIPELLSVNLMRFDSRKKIEGYYKPIYKLTDEGNSALDDYEELTGDRTASSS